MTFRTVKRGQRIMDQHGQVCRVEAVQGRGRSRLSRQVVTRRLEGGKFWDCTAVWTPEAFDGRQWSRVA